MKQEFEGQILLFDENKDNVAFITDQITYIFSNDFALVGKIENPKGVYHFSKIRNNEYLLEVFLDGRNIVYFFSIELMKFQIIEKEFAKQIVTAISLNEKQILISFWNHSDSVFKIELKLNEEKVDVDNHEQISLNYYGMVVSFLV